MDEHEADVIEALAALIRDVDGRHQLGAAALAEALVQRGVTIRTGTSRQVYAVATMLHDGTTRALSAPLPTPGEAAHERAVMLGDDYYRDQHPFVATSVQSSWIPVDTGVLIEPGPQAPAVAVIDSGAQPTPRLPDLRR